MKILPVLFAAALLLPGSLPTQAPAQPTPAEAAAMKLSPDELKRLVAPIALYPDPLLAQVLAASTVPTDVTLAARFLAAKKDVSQIEAQPWDESVKSLVRYPEIIQRMDADLDGTVRLGEAFVNQQPDLIAAVQALRLAAQEKGNLQTTKEQKVVVEKQVVRIEPAQPEVIYVPQYDPVAVYERPYDPAVPLLSFGAGLAMGAWLSHGFDWNRGYVGYWPGGYYRPGAGWNGGNNVIVGNRPGRPTVRPWRPNPNRPGLGNRPQVNRPVTLPAKVDRPNRPAVRPGNLGAVRPDKRAPQTRQFSQRAKASRPSAVRPSRPSIQRPASIRRPAVVQRRPAIRRPATGQRPAIRRPAAVKRPMVRPSAPRAIRRR